MKFDLGQRACWYAAISKLSINFGPLLADNMISSKKHVQ